MDSITHVEQQSKGLTVTWANGHSCEFAFVFLRDNDPANLHANGQKVTGVTQLDVTITPDRFSLNDDGSLLEITWSTDAKSVYTTAWLLNCGEIEKRTECPMPALWGNEINDKLIVFDYADLQEERSLLEWLTAIVYNGFGLVKNVPVIPGQLLELIRMFGYPRETNYGVLFDVRTVINPVNLAFTNRGISPHTDNPYRYPTPTLQVLHCMSASASGGDSVLVDGFKVAEVLKATHPDFFTILATTPVTFQYRDQDNWIENTTTIIQCNAAGIIQSIRYNSRSIQPVMQRIDKAVEFYEAYICWAKLVEDERFAISFRMDPGDLYLVDNERILHARTAFGNEGGERWLQGAYADRDGLLSTWRVLSHKISQTVI